MSRARPHRLKPEHVRSAIFRLSNRLRQSPHLIYEFDGATRILLLQVKIDPEKSFRKLIEFLRTTEEIPTWERALEYCDEAQFDLREFCKLQAWRIEDLETLYHEVRGMAADVRATA